MHEKEMSSFFEGVRNTILSIVLVNGISLIFKSYTLYWILTWFLIPLYLVLVAHSLSVECGLIIVVYSCCAGGIYELYNSKHFRS